MGGVTIAHQPVSNEIENDDNYSKNFVNQAIDQAQLNQLLVNSSDWPNELPVEDLTNEAQELMMRESVNSWLQPWTTENVNCLSDLNAQMIAQSIQLESLFGQNQLDFTNDLSQTHIYDELSFVPDDASLILSASTSSASSPFDSSNQTSPMLQESLDMNLDLIEPVPIVDKLEIIEPIVSKRRRSSSSSEESSSGSDSSSGEEESDSEREDVVIPTTVANLNSRRGRVNYSSDSDSDSDNEVTSGRVTSPIVSPYMYMHKRQIEETLLDRITNQLDPEKLPGILPILSSDKAASGEEEEIEIDLSCIAREQLVQVLSYVDACILEQNGGPSVRVEDFIEKKKSSVKKRPRTRPAIVPGEQKKRAARRRPCAPKTKTRAELTEDIDGDSSSSDEEIIKSVKHNIPKQKPVTGPISMASLSKSTDLKKSPSHSHKRPAAKKSKSSRNRRKQDDDALVSSSIAIARDPDCIASSRPKRHVPLHKRRLLEKMLAPSDEEEEDEETEIVVYGDEKMDFDILDNQTIAHQTEVIHTSVPIVSIAAEDHEDTDEEIDILF